MFEQLRVERLIKKLKQIFDEFPDLRKGKNNQYEMADAGLGAFSVFFTQCASFLEHQEEIKRRKGRSNAESLFEMVNIPSDNHIRGLLDPVLPKLLSPMYRIIFQRLEQTGILDQMRSHAKSLLIAIDGTEYFSSQKIQCPIFLGGVEHHCRRQDGMRARQRDIQYLCALFLHRNIRSRVACNVA